MLKLKELRKEKRLSQKQVAEIVNYSQNLISSWEHGLREPSLEALITLANFFNVSVDYLIGNDVNLPKEFNNSLNIKLTRHLTSNQQACIKDILELDDVLVVQAKIYIKALKEAHEVLMKKENVKVS
ncbi:MAG: helix-turn-helix transcriptional regulator [Clostridiales bacterium]|nr:helix-turn-helix transcriptional regulator [Clostridiales bacterium]